MKEFNIKDLYDLIIKNLDDKNIEITGTELNNSEFLIYFKSRYVNHVKFDDDSATIWLKIGFKKYNIYINLLRTDKDNFKMEVFYKIIDRLFNDKYYHKKLLKTHKIKYSDYFRSLTKSFDDNYLDLIIINSEGDFVYKTEVTLTIKV